MGRGRQKAKHTKVARELKYFSPSTDLGALERELGSRDAEGEAELIDKWADLYPDDDAEEDASAAEALDQAAKDDAVSEATQADEPENPDAN